MDKISDILDSIKDRLTNPIFVSFIISWMFCNWEITVALLWYNSDYWKTPGSLTSYIACHNNWWDSIVLPIMFAIGYISLNPVAKNLIKIITLKIDNWGDKQQEEISKDTRVNFEVYREKYNELKERENSLAAIQNEQKDTREKMQNIADELSTAKATIVEKDKIIESRKNSYSEEIETLKAEIDRLNNKVIIQEKEIADFTSEKTLEGIWLIEYENNDPLHPSYMYVSFSKDNFPVSASSLHPPLPDGETLYLYQLTAVLRKEKCMLIIASTDSQGYNRRFLNLERSGVDWQGFENGLPIRLSKRTIEDEIANQF